MGFARVPVLHVSRFCTCPGCSVWGFQSTSIQCADFRWPKLCVPHNFSQAKSCSVWVLHVSQFCTCPGFARVPVVVYGGFSQLGGLDFEVKNNKITPSPKSLIWRDFYIFGDLTNILCRYKGNTSHTNYIRFMGEFTRVG